MTRSFCQQRGGFCYEQNGLFAAVLREMGYQVTMLQARVGAKDWDSGTPFDHMTLLVELDERWLADVGFGDSFMEPLRFDDATPTDTDLAGCSGCSMTVWTGCMNGRRKVATGTPSICSGCNQHTLADFEPGCQHNQYSPKSHFTQQRVCSLATPEGRITLSDRRLIVTKNGHRREQDLESDAEFQRHLHDHFGITF